MRDFIQIFLYVIGIFFAIYMVGYASFQFLSVCVGTSSLYGLKRRNLLKNELGSGYYIPVSLIVPAHNESVTIKDTIHSLLQLEYHLYEIIIVDDGSSDDTAKILCDEFHLYQVHRPIQKKIACKNIITVYESNEHKVNITLICKENGGKADALNMGINAAKYPYFVCMDADSLLQFDSLEKIVRPILEDDNVVAVGGAIRPCNDITIINGKVSDYHLPKRLLPSMQVLEYDRSFLASRILFDKFNGNIIISGAFGLFQKKVVIDAGGYDANTVGEDMELVVKLHVYCRQHHMPYHIRYAADAICWTQVPEKLKDLCGQRRRWHTGLFQSMMKHHDILANPQYGVVGFISYLYFLFYELFSPFIEVFGLFTVILASFADFLNVPFMLLYSLIYVVYSALLSLSAFFARIHTIDLQLSFRDILKAFLLCVVEITCLRFLLTFVRLTSLIRYRKHKSGWGKIERTSMNVSQEVG